MLPGESSCPGGSEYVWQRGVEGVLGRVTGGRGLSYFPKKIANIAVLQINTTPKILGIELAKSLLPIDYGKKWFAWWSSISKIVGVVFMCKIFANGPHLVALTQIRATKTGSNNFCTPLSYIFSESWVRKVPWVLAPKNVQVRSDLRNISIFHWFPCLYPQKEVSGTCTNNFDATDLPNS